MFVKIFKTGAAYQDWVHQSPYMLEIMSVIVFDGEIIVTGKVK